MSQGGAASTRLRQIDLASGVLELDLPTECII
jgi:hypothetical protein